MKKTARHAAALALLAVTQQGGYSNIVLDHVLEQEDLSVEDRSFCAALLYTTVQHLLTLDHLLASLCRGKKPDPTVGVCLRLGLCQLLYMDSVPDGVAVHQTVELCKALGQPQASGFVNGVLRAFLRSDKALPLPKDPLTALSVAHSLPMPLIQLWRKAYGHPATLAILEGLEATPPLFLRTNTLATTPAALVAQLAEEGLTATPVEGYPQALQLQSAPGGIARLASFQQGLFHVQDLSSQRCCLAPLADGFAPQRTLDLCAAPGGKSFTLAEATGAPVVARDLYPARLALVSQGAARLGLGQVTAQVGDATVYDPALGLFDLVLCDVVCSGFGILRRKPEIRYKPLQTLDALPDLQYTILNMACRYCAPGGRVVYSTCTLHPQENQGVVERLLADKPAFTLYAPPTTILPGEATPPPDSGLSPGHGGDGFFYAILQHNP